MNLYLTLIGIISTISCILIIICINSKSTQPFTTPTEGSKSPLLDKGLNDSQKSQILLIVCIIFFLSLLTTNVKTSKFSSIFHNMITSFSQETSPEQVADLREVFYGSKGSCQVKPKTEKYPHLFENLKETQMEEKFMQKLYQKNFQEFTVYEKKHSTVIETQYERNGLLLVNSKFQQMGAELILPLVNQKICKSSQSRVPTVYLDLDKKVQSEQHLMNLLKVGSYDSLKQSMCKLNGIQIQRQVQRIGSYIFEKQTYTVVDSKKSPGQKVHFIINNYHFLNDVLIFSRKMPLNQDFKRDQSQEDHLTSPLNFKPEYQLFIDKLLNDLVKNCQINLILHTCHQGEVSKLYQNWKSFRRQNQQKISLNQRVSLDDFPFDVKVWKGITKFQAFELIKEMIQQSSALRQIENSVWKSFEKLFGKVVNPTIKLPVEADSSLYKENEEQITLSQLDKLFAKVIVQTQKLKNNPRQADKGKLKSIDLKSYIAEYYGLDSSYEVIKSLANSKSGHKQVSLGSLKRKISIQQIKMLQQMGLIHLNQGKVLLTE